MRTVFSVLGSFVENACRLVGVAQECRFARCVERTEVG